MLGAKLQQLQLKSVYVFQSEILRRPGGASDLLRTVTFYPTSGDAGQLISRIDHINFREVTDNACGMTQYMPINTERRMLSKVQKEAAIKYSWAQLAETNQDWVGAAVKEIMDGAQRAIDSTILKSLGDSAEVQVDNDKGTAPVTAAQDGVVVIDATTGDGFTREKLQEVRVNMENNGCAIGMGTDNMITVALPPQAYAQLINSYGTSLPAYNYQEEFINNGIASGSRIIDGMRVIELSSCMFPKDPGTTNLIGGAYTKNAIGLSIIGNNILDPVHGVYEGKRMEYTMGYEHIGAPWITQEAMAMQCIVIQLRFLIGATRLDPKRVVLIKFRPTI